MVFLNQVYIHIVSALVYVPLIWPLKLVSIYQVSASSTDTDKVGFQIDNTSDHSGSHSSWIFVTKCHNLKGDTVEVETIDGI